MDLLKHKGYEGTAEIDMDREVCFGKVLFINDLVTYEADSPTALQVAFKEAVDDYLETCRTLGKVAQKSLRGTFNVRISAEMHRQAIRKALSLNTTLNEVVTRALGQFLNSQTSVEKVTTIVVSKQPKFEVVKIPTSVGANHWHGKTYKVRAGDC